MLLTKAWIAPAAAWLGVLLFDRVTLKNAFKQWHQSASDVPIMLWCLWPLLQSMLSQHTKPAGWVASLYITGCWGLPWLLGRIYFSTPENQRLLLQGLVLSALICLPFSLIESVWGPALYGIFYEPHPFKFDGDVRYLGFRPMGFFEHGNQFGLWISLCALVAVWWAYVAPQHADKRLAWLIASAVALMALAAQSVGGILIFGLGVAFLSACSLLRPRWMVATALSTLMLGGAIYVSGVVPVNQLARDTALGQKVVSSLRAVGRGSLAWRISQDQKLLPAAMAQPAVGTGSWNWWQAKGMRPWGLWMLLLGQFGLVGLSLCLSCLLWPALREGWYAKHLSGWHAQSMPLLLACIIALTVVDALLNSFIFFPALLMAGGLAGRVPRSTVSTL
jgi:hypothetical protein